MFTLHPIDSLTGSINLYSLAVNYRHHIDSIHGSPLGVYFIVRRLVLPLCLDR
jgi:hypothetical protein